MWTRNELKQRGKEAFKRNYWKSVLMGLVMFVLAGGGASISRGTSGSGNDMSGTSDNLMAIVNGTASELNVSVGMVYGVLVGIFSAALLISILWNVFLVNPVNVGASRFFVVNAGMPAEIGEIGYAFGKGRYLKTVATQVLANIFIFLWSLLFIIPGIIKSYQYRMVPYILADNPQLSPRECLDKSKEMMKGQLWNTFVLDLSFIGWHLLSIITCGIVAVLYTIPYTEATNAELYLSLKTQKNF